jgi:hypothetical protein
MEKVSVKKRSEKWPSLIEEVKRETREIPFGRAIRGTCWGWFGRHWCLKVDAKGAVEMFEWRRQGGDVKKAKVKCWCVELMW